MQQLLALLEAAGHSAFRDARGPMGFTQRQAAGKFTRSEVEAFIEQLEAEDQQGDAAPPAAPPRSSAKAAPRAATSTAALSSTEQALRTVPSSLLAAELQRRGWVVMEP